MSVEREADALSGVNSGIFRLVVTLSNRTARIAATFGSLDRQHCDLCRFMRGRRGRGGGTTAGGHARSFFMSPAR